MPAGRFYKSLSWWIQVLALHLTFEGLLSQDDEVEWQLKIIDIVIFNFFVFYTQPAHTHAHTFMNTKPVFLAVTEELQNAGGI